MDNKKFYIIGRTDKIAGIGALAGSALTHIAYAFDNNLIPVVDLQHYKNQYFKDNRTYKDNTWEYFFKQPAGYNLNDISQDSDCIISDNIFTSEPKYALGCHHLPVKSFKSQDERINNLHDKFHEYLKFNDEMQNYVENRYNDIVANNKNILGVLVRGTDYIIKKPKGENINPSPKTVIRKVEQFLKKHSDISKIYIATEDENIFQMFKNKFGDMLIDNNQYRYTYNKKEKKFLVDIKIDRPNHNYELAKEYLASLYILSKCKYFIGGRCSGTKTAWILSEGWDDVFIWDLGKYGKCKYNPIKYIFELTNKYDENMQKYKELTILGLKFKLRRKNPRNK